ncbi:MAG: hypothetical protein ACYCVL_07875 [Gemmatimonadaceae bacterium]
MSDAAALGAQRFLSEIKTTAALQHPHILPRHRARSGLTHALEPQFVQLGHQPPRQLELLDGLSKANRANAGMTMFGGVVARRCRRWDNSGRRGSRPPYTYRGIPK